MKDHILMLTRTNDQAKDLFHECANECRRLSDADKKFWWVASYNDYRIETDDTVYRFRYVGTFEDLDLFAGYVFCTVVNFGAHWRAYSALQERVRWPI
jgi:hypothetical protein